MKILLVKELDSSAYKLAESLNIREICVGIPSYLADRVSLTDLPFVHEEPETGRN